MVLINVLMNLTIKEPLKETYINMLNQIGFKNIETFIDFNRNNHDDHGERLFFVAFNK